MTKALAPISDARVLPSPIGPVIPIVDIAALLGYSRSAITKATKRHEGKITPLTTFLPLPTSRGMQRFKCLNREGVDLLFLFIHPSNERMDDDKFIALHQSILEKMGIKRAEIVSSRPSAPDPLIASLNRNADIAEILINRYDYDPVVAHNLAMTNVVNEVGDIAHSWKGPAMLPAAEPRAYEYCEKCSMHEEDPDFDRYFSLRKIAEIVKESEDRVRNILEKEGLLSYSNTIWHLTRTGEQFGKVFTTYPLWPHRMTEKKNIRWSPAAIERIRIHLSAGQTQLASATSRG